ncbi:hypothetical protein KP509_14G005100 [Ceratopteris richardii]|uniref:Seipin n=1 Tax=Ceratopteris richardii TaxID=49495 RepID=A0A8T2T5B5_CERRI|nr:hypothetical protein KP509_14G005100 [Ceratopteris richardii]
MLDQSERERVDVPDSQATEDASSCCFSQSRSISEETSLSCTSPHAPSEEERSCMGNESCVASHMEEDKPRPPADSDVNPNTALPLKGTKIQRQLCMDDFDRSAALDAMKRNSSDSHRNVPPCSEWIPQNVVSNSFGGQYMKKMGKEVLGDSCFPHEQKRCTNMKLPDNFVHDRLEFFTVKAADQSAAMNRKKYESEYESLSNVQELLSRCIHVLPWLVQLPMRALRYQWNFFFQMPLTLLLAWYHCFLLVTHPVSYLKQAKAKFTEACVNKESNIQNHGDQDSILSPTIATGVKKVTLGSIVVLYTISLLTCLFAASLILSSCIVNGFVYDPVQFYEYLFFDYTQPFPTASIDITDSVMYPNMGALLKRLPRPTTRFHATVYLTVPESGFNKELGIFQVTAEVISVTGQVLLNKTQPCMLQFRSTILQHIKALVMAVPLLTGSYLEKQTLVVSSLNWQGHGSLPLGTLRVVLAPRAGNPLLTGLPELYEAGIRVESQISWWACIIGNWRWTISVWLGMALFIGAIVIGMGLCNQFLVPDLRAVFSILRRCLSTRQWVDYRMKNTYSKHKFLSAEHVRSGSKHQL